MVLILALGVAVYLSIRLANRAAVNSFQHFTDLVTAGSDWVIQAPAGDLPESVLGELRRALGTDPFEIIPVLESTATRPPQGGDDAIGSRATFRLLGLDLIGIQNFGREQRRDGDRSWFASRPEVEAVKSGDESSTSQANDFWTAMRNPRSVFISASLARRDGLGPGALLELVINEAVVALQVAGIIPSRPDQPDVPETLLVMDLPALQELTGRTGSLTRVEFRVMPGAHEASRRSRLRDLLEAQAKVATIGPDLESPAHRWTVLSPAGRREAAGMMTRAFRLNLTILSLLALLVGLYLIVQALDGAVVRRRMEIAVLRSLGVEERAIRNAWLVEAAAVGLAGGVLGTLLGWAGAQVSVRFVGRTVNALYYATHAESAALSLGEVLGALGLACVTSVLAGAWPAHAAARTPPAQLLARHPSTAPPAWAWEHPGVGAVLILVGWGCALLPPLRFEGGVRFPMGGYLAALAWIVGAGILGGWGLGSLARLLRPMGRFSVTARLATSHLTRPSGRHVLATAGLVCAVAMTAGMVILVASFDRTMRGWIARTFQSDLYVSSAGAQSASTDNRISPATWMSLVDHPGVADANVLHACEVRLPGGTTILAASDFGYARRNIDFAWVEPPRGADIQFDEADRQGTGPVLAFASESYAERFQAGRGDTVILPTPSGPKSLRLAGVFADYGNERGSLIVDSRHFTNWFQTPYASTVIARLKEPARAEAIRAEWLARHPGLQIFTNAQLRLEVLRIFRQTFAITYALEAIGLAVAVFGLAMTLASVLLERRGELTTLRALGMRRQHLARAAAAEGLIMAASGLIAGLVVSIALGWLLINVINKQTFGWTLQFAIPGAPLALLGALVVGAALVVGVAVGHWGAQLPADREE